MREILFRGKRKENGKWVEGGFSIVERFSFIILPFVEWDDDVHMEIPQFVEVDPETVCQYTGLTDKNGRKIFDGDILSAHLDSSYPEDTTYVQITWNGFSWCMRESTEDDVITEHDCNVFEVCGNTFDNPELIGGQP